MDNFSGESEVTQQVNSKPTKPDESRKKSLYFLLLAVGRQIAVNNPSLRKEYREALNSLEIHKSEESWLLTVTMGEREIERIIPRNEFRFYSTGLANSEDAIVESNKRAAISYWNSVASEITNESDLTSQRKINLNLKLSKFEIIKITTALQLGLIFVVFLPEPQKILPFYLLAVYPIVRLFWHSSKKIMFLTLYLIAVILFTLTIDFSTLSQTQMDGSLPYALLIFLLWSQFSRRKIQVNRRSSTSKIVTALMVGLPLYAFLTTSSQFTIVLICLLILSSEVMQYLRRNYIHDSRVVIMSSIFEVSMSLVAGFYILSRNFNQSEISLNERLVFIFVYLLWFIYLNIYEKYPITFRIFYPILFILSIIDQHLSLQAFLTAIVIISSVIIISGSEGRRPVSHE